MAIPRLGDRLVDEGSISKDQLELALSLQKDLRIALSSCFIDMDLQSLKNKYGNQVEIILRDFGKKISNNIGNTSFLLGDIIKGLYEIDIQTALNKLHGKNIRRGIFIELNKFLEGLFGKVRIPFTIKLNTLVQESSFSEQLCLETGELSCPIKYSIIKGYFILCSPSPRCEQLLVEYPFTYCVLTQSIEIFSCTSNKETLKRIIKKRIEDYSKII